MLFLDTLFAWGVLFGNPHHVTINWRKPVTGKSNNNQSIREVAGTGCSRSRVQRLFWFWGTHGQSQVSTAIFHFLICLKGGHLLTRLSAGASTFLAVACGGHPFHVHSTHLPIMSACGRSVLSRDPGLRCSLSFSVLFSNLIDRLAR